MKANARVNALAFLLVVACNRPDADLFGDDPPLPIGNRAGADSSPSTGGLTSGAGSKAVGGGTGGTEPAPGGSATTAGGPSGNDAGAPNPPDDQGAAGAAAGAGGQGEPEPPVGPVCGNGILEAGEQCDDLGQAGQDGCDATCKVVCAHFGADAVVSADHHCYNGYDAADFDGAQEACVERGGHLVTISSAAENEIARSFVNNSKWLGGFEDVSVTVKGTGSYAWLSGEPFTYMNWAQREPDQARVRCGESNSSNQSSCYEHCLSMDGAGKWADARCDVSDGYVCEWDPAGMK